MALIVRPDERALTEENSGIMMIPAEVPSFRLMQAKQRNVDKNVLIEVWGGLGDIVCAEPAIRFAIREFPELEFSVETWFPDLFGHLQLCKVFNTNIERADKNKYFVHKSMYTTESLSWEFVRYAVCHRIDYVSLALFGRQMPVEDRCIKFVPSEEDYKVAALVSRKDRIVLHPGRTWASRTMPKEWWDTLIKHLVSKGHDPLIIGSEWDDGKRGTVQVDASSCCDVRGKLTRMETIAALHLCGALITNDSAPLHMAASGKAHIAFLSTANHPDYITHWRSTLGDEDVEWGWRMKNFAKGGMYEEVRMLPNETERLVLNECTEAQMRKWLPNPTDVADWALEKL